MTSNNETSTSYSRGAAKRIAASKMYAASGEIIRNVRAYVDAGG